ncbi:MAG: phosphopantetheine-binding protein, partial [Acidobacteriota bacterium]
EEGYFFLEDRLKDMVNVGGLKVFPAEVENVILQHAAIADAAVYGVANALFGERVVAAVVLKEGQRASADSIRTMCRDRLAEYKVPDEVAFLEEIPRSPTGKVLKRILRQRHPANSIRTTFLPIGNDRSDAPRASAARDWIAQWLTDTLCIQRGEVDAEKSFFDYGLTSSQAMKLASDAGEWLGMSLGATIAWRFPTVDELARHLADPRSNPEGDESAPRAETGLDGFSIAEIAELLSAEIAASKQRKSR